MKCTLYVCKQLNQHQQFVLLKCLYISFGVFKGDFCGVGKTASFLSFFSANARSRRFVYNVHEQVSKFVFKIYMMHIIFTFIDNMVSQRFLFSKILHEHFMNNLCISCVSILKIYLIQVNQFALESNAVCFCPIFLVDIQLFPCEMEN